MADYALTKGVATSVTQDDPSEEGYVNVDMAEADSPLTPVLGTDLMLVQRGASACQSATLAVLAALVQAADVDWLNNGYLY